MNIFKKTYRMANKAIDYLAEGYERIYQTDPTLLARTGRYM